jgi:hypothetical protein
MPICLFFIINLLVKPCEEFYAQSLLTLRGVLRQVSLQRHADALNSNVP